MTILEQIDNLIENTIIYEGSLQRRLGIRFKTIVDPKTGKSHIFRVNRNDNVNGKGPAIRQSWHEDGPNKIPTIFIPDHKGRTHPATFYHEIGHELRNNPLNINPSQIRAEKEAWQGAKELRPDLYNMAKKDGTLQKAFGSYVDQWRDENIKYRNLVRKADRLPTNGPLKDLTLDALGRVTFANELGGGANKWLMQFSKDQLKKGTSRSDIAKAIKFSRPLVRNNQFPTTNSQLLKIPEQTPDQIKLYSKKGWNL